ncbi:MAG: hypothetical protein KGP29_06145 [Proteobacteria bacterium]|nr:hypothetical protein [Pseudomonadota bacterium]
MLLISSCSMKKKALMHTEISCLGKPAVLVRYTYLEEVKASIKKNYLNKQRLKTTEDYSVIYASGGRSVKIQGVSPEKILECSLREIPVLRPDKNIVKYTDY